MYGYIIAITVSVLIGLYVGWWLGYQSYSTGLVEGINMMENIQRRQKEKEESDTGRTPWFHSLDVRDAVNKINGEN